MGSSGTILMFYSCVCVFVFVFSTLAALIHREGSEGSIGREEFPHPPHSLPHHTHIAKRQNKVRPSDFCTVVSIPFDAMKYFLNTQLPVNGPWYSIL